MNIRGALLLAYCAALAAGTWWIIDRNDLAAADFRAARDLPANRRLQAGDVEGPVGARGAMLADHTSLAHFDGRYILAATPAGAQFRIGATDTMPRLTPHAGTQMLAVSLPRDRLAAVNAETCVRLAGKDDKLVTVRAVLCPAASGASCTAVVEAAAAHAAALVAEAAPLAVAAAVDCP